MIFHVERTKGTVLLPASFPRRSRHPLNSDGRIFSSRAYSLQQLKSATIPGRSNPHKTVDVIEDKAWGSDVMDFAPQGSAARFVCAVVFLKICYVCFS